MSPRLQRVIIVDSSPGSARMLRDSMRLFSKGKIHCVETNDNGFELAKDFNPQLFIIDLGGDPGAALQLVRRIRRSYLACRHAPISRCFTA
jgi:DNA-binding response OmpR family regulator